MTLLRGVIGFQVQKLLYRRCSHFTSFEYFCTGPFLLPQLDMIFFTASNARATHNLCNDNLCNWAGAICVILDITQIIVSDILKAFCGCSGDRVEASSNILL